MSHGLNESGFLCNKSHNARRSQLPLQLRVCVLLHTYFVLDQLLVWHMQKDNIARHCPWLYGNDEPVKIVHEVILYKDVAAHNSC